MLSETITFGGGGLDRVASLRADVGAAIAAAAGCRYLPLWRGRPLYADEGLTALAYLDAGHALVAAATARAALIGRDEAGVLIFAFEIPDWNESATEAARKAGNFDRLSVRHPDLPGDAVFADLRMGMAGLSPIDAGVAVTARGLFAWHETHGFCASCGAKSEIAMAGWQRDCRTCGRAHFPRTDPVVIMLITHGNSVLLGRSPGWPEGMYSLLAGFVEPGETIEAAVRREVLEETNVRVGAVHYLASQPWPFPSSLMLGCAGEALSTEITIDPAEIEDALWLTREDMLDVYAGRHPTIKPARRGSIAHFLIENWLADRRWTLQKPSIKVAEATYEV